MRVHVSRCAGVVGGNVVGGGVVDGGVVGGGLLAKSGWWRSCRRSSF